MNPHVCQTCIMIKRAIYQLAIQYQNHQSCRKHHTLWKRWNIRKLLCKIDRHLRVADTHRWRKDTSGKRTKYPDLNPQNHRRHVSNHKRYDRKESSSPPKKAEGSMYQQGKAYKDAIPPTPNFPSVSKVPSSVQDIHLRDSSGNAVASTAFKDHATGSNRYFFTLDFQP